MNSKKTVVRITPWVIGAVLTSSTTITLADWAVAPFAKSSIVFDDNIQFTSDDAQVSLGINLDAGVVVSNETEAVKTEVTPRVAYNTYVEDSGLNTVNAYLDFSTTSYGERSDLGLDLRLANDSTRTSELSDSGRVSLNKRRTYFSMSPNWKYLLTPLISMKVEYLFNGSQYEDSGESGLNNYEFQRARVGLDKRLSEETDAFVRGYYQRYKVLELTNKARSFGLEGGYNTEWTPKFSTRAAIGAVATESTVEGVDDDSTGVSASIGLRYRAETTSYHVQIRSAVVPSSAGEVFHQNSVRFDITGTRTTQVSWSVRGDWIDRSAVREESDQSDRTYYRINPTITYKLTQDWSLAFRYGFSYQKRSDGGNATRNQAYIGLTYRKAPSVIY